jgi:hypothetical protein
MQYYVLEANSALVFRNHFSYYRLLHACACTFCVPFTSTEFITTPLHKLTRGRNLHMRLEQDREYTYKRNVEVRSRNHCYHGRVLSVAYSECMPVALVINMNSEWALLVTC